MKTLVLLALVPLAQIARAEDDLPKPQLFARYDAMMNRSPFAVATAAAPPPQTPNFAKDLYIANAAKLRDETIATLASNVDKNFKEYLSSKDPNKDGYAIANTDWSEHVGMTKVTISKDGQFATLTFNQALLSQPASNAPAPQPQPQVAAPIPAITPPQPPIGTPNGNVSVPNVTTPKTNPVNRIQPAPVPTLPTPPPRVRGVIQRNPNTAQSPVPDDRAQLSQEQ